MPVLACTHVGITVTDLARSRRFFIEGLGFEPVPTVSGDRHTIDASGEYGILVAQLLELDEFDADVEFLRRDGMTIELVAYKRPEPVADARRRSNICGPTHLCFDVDDIDRTVEQLVNLGGSVLRHTDHTVEFSAAARVRLVLCLDPDDGTKIELKQRV